mmetsp:Transcript_2531/g.5842  ORF Transcript_2531/g.5842 Transcript_2531/m.5842 type:complete len:200 (+) Transcript_2531:471-1070(+)
MFGLLELVWDDLIDYHASNPHIVVLAKHPIQLQFIERRSKPSICYEHHVRTKSRCHLSVIDIDDAAHAAVSSTLGNHHITRVTHMLKRSLNVSNLLLVGNLAIDELLRIPPRDDDGGHVFVIQMIKLEVLSHQYNILVDACGLARRGPDLDVLLSNRFDKSDTFEAFFQPRHDGERRAGLADVLLGGSDEDGTLISSVG